MNHPVLPLKRDQTFCFTCSPQVPCFNACCRDLHQVLTPYDVLRLKQFLNRSSTDFLRTYTEENLGPQTGLPVVSLRFSASASLACPFVSDAGCRVYPARPGSCRSYPLARGVSRNRETGLMREHWALIHEPHCLGFTNGRPQRVDQWVADQQIAAHYHMSDRLLELISLKNQVRPGPLTASEKNRVYTALYDLDAFREELFVAGGAPAVAVDALTLERARSEDRDLLLVAMQWVRQLLMAPSSGKDRL